MSDAMPDTAAVVPLPAPMFKRVTRLPHIFGRAMLVTATEADDGLERHERWCSACQLVRITVITPAWAKKNPPAWREYRHGAESSAFIEDREPDCPGVVKAEAGEVKAS